MIIFYKDEELRLMKDIKRISIVAGHYGSGKTNVSVNMAVRLAQQGKKVIIVDLDIVNPYFRAADFKDYLESLGIHVIAPTYANTNLDIPALPAEINTIFDTTDSHVIIDVGGDDAGAIALGRYSELIKSEDYDMYYVINENRYHTKNAGEALELLQCIEYCARVKATKLINNSNLGDETTVETLKHSLAFADELSEKTNLPLAFTCIKSDLYEAAAAESIPNLISIEMFVKPFYNE